MEPDIWKGRHYHFRVNVTSDLKICWKTRHHRFVMTYVPTMLLVDGVAMAKVRDNIDKFFSEPEGCEPYDSAKQ